MSKFEESNFYKALQDFFINADKKTFLQFLAEFYNRTEGIIDKDNIQDDLIKELRELYLEFNEKGIDENIVREKVNYFVENNVKIKDIIAKLTTNTNNIKNINSQLGTKAEKINSIDYINVVELGIDNTGEIDVTNDLQTLFDNALPQSIFFFPNGVYKISKGLIINNITLIGNFTGSYSWDKKENAYSVIYLVGGNSNVDIISAKNKDSRIMIKNLMIKSDSCTSTINNFIPDVNNCGDMYSITINDENVNGINLRKNLNVTVDNVYIEGCSGYGIDCGVVNYIKNVITKDCNIGFVVYMDNRVINPYATLCNIGYKITGANNNITGLWCDRIRTYGIYTEEDTSILVGQNIINGNLDQIGYCGLYINGIEFVNNKVDLTMCRVGQYFAGYNYDNINSNEKYKSCAVYNNSKINSCSINIQVTYSIVSDKGTGGKCPSCKIINNNTIQRSFIIMPNSFDSLTSDTFKTFINNSNIYATTISDGLRNYVFDFTGVNGLIPIVKMGNGAPDFSCFQSSFYIDTDTKELYVNLWGGTGWEKIKTNNS